MKRKKTVLQKTTLVLSNRQVAWLDHISAVIRLHTGAAMRRSSLLRAVVEAMQESGLDLSDCSSEEAVKQRVLAELTRSRR